MAPDAGKQENQMKSSVKKELYMYVMIKECKNNVLILWDKFSTKYKTKPKS